MKHSSVPGETGQDTEPRGGKKRFGFIWTSKEKEIEVREGEKKFH